MPNEIEAGVIEYEGQPDELLAAAQMQQSEPAALQEAREMQRGPNPDQGFAAQRNIAAGVPEGYYDALKNPNRAPKNFVFAALAGDAEFKAALEEAKSSMSLFRARYRELEPMLWPQQAIAKLESKIPAVQTEPEVKAITDQIVAIRGIGDAARAKAKEWLWDVFKIHSNATLKMLAAGLEVVGEVLADVENQETEFFAKFGFPRTATPIFAEAKRAEKRLIEMVGSVRAMHGRNDAATLTDFEDAIHYFADIEA